MEQAAALRQAVFHRREAPAAYVISSRLISACRIDAEWVSSTTKVSVRCSEAPKPVHNPGAGEPPPESSVAALMSGDSHSSHTGTPVVSSGRGSSLLTKVPLFGRLLRTRVRETLRPEGGANPSAVSSDSASIVAASAVNSAPNGDSATAPTCAREVRRGVASSGVAKPSLPDSLCCLSSSLLPNTYATRWKNHFFLLVWQHTKVYCYVTPLHQAPYGQVSRSAASAPDMRLFVYDTVACEWPGPVSQAYVDPEHCLLLLVITPGSSSSSPLPSSAPPSQMLDSDGRLTLLLHFDPLLLRCTSGDRKGSEFAYGFPERNGAAASSFSSSLPLTPFEVLRGCSSCSGSRRDGERQGSRRSALVPHWLPVSHVVVVPAPLFGVTSVFRCSAGLLLFSCSSRRTLSGEKKASLLLLRLVELQNFFSVRGTPALAGYRNGYLDDKRKFLPNYDHVCPYDHAPTRPDLSIPTADVSAAVSSVAHSGDLHASNGEPGRGFCVGSRRGSSEAVGTNNQPEQFSSTGFTKQPQHHLEELPLSCFTSEHFPALPSNPSAAAVDEASQRLLLAGFCFEEQRPWLAIACWRNLRLELDEADYNDPYRSRLCSRYGADASAPTAAGSSTDADFLGASHSPAVTDSFASVSCSLTAQDAAATSAERPQVRGRGAAAADASTLADAEGCGVGDTAADDDADLQEAEDAFDEDISEEKGKPLLVMLPLLEHLRTAAKVAASLRRLALTEAACRDLSSRRGLQPRQRNLSYEQLQVPQPTHAGQPQWQNVAVPGSTPMRSRSPGAAEKLHGADDAAWPAAAENEQDSEERDAAFEQACGVSGKWGVSFYRPLKMKEVTALLQQVDACTERRLHAAGGCIGSNNGGAASPDESGIHSGGEAGTEVKEADVGTELTGRGAVADIFAAASRWCGMQQAEQEELTEIVQIAVSASGDRIALAFSSSEILILRRSASQEKRTGSWAAPAEGTAEALHSSSPHATAAGPTTTKTRVALVEESRGTPASSASSFSPHGDNRSSGAAADILSSGAHARDARVSTASAAGADAEQAAPAVGAGSSAAVCSGHPSASCTASDSRFSPSSESPYVPWLYFPTAYITYLRIAASLGEPSSGDTAAGASAVGFSADTGINIARTGNSFPLTTVLRERQEYEGLSGIVGIYFERPVHVRNSCSVRTPHSKRRCEVARIKDGKMNEGSSGHGGAAAARAASKATHVSEATTRSARRREVQLGSDDEDEVLVLVLGARGSVKTLQGLQELDASSPCAAEWRTTADADQDGGTAAVPGVGEAKTALSRSTANFSASPSLSLDVCAVDLRAAAAAAEAGLAETMARRAGAQAAVATAAQATRSGCHDINMGKGMALLPDAAAYGGTNRWLCSCVLPDAFGAVGLAVLPPQQSSAFDAEGAAETAENAAAASPRQAGAAGEEKRDLFTGSRSVASDRGETGGGGGEERLDSHERWQQPQQQTAVLLTLEQVEEEDDCAVAAARGVQAPTCDAVAADETLTAADRKVPSADSVCRKPDKKNKRWQRLCVWQVCTEDAYAYVKKLLQQQRFVEAECVCCNALSNLAFSSDDTEPSASHVDWWEKKLKKKAKGVTQQEQQQLRSLLSPMEEYSLLLEEVRAARWERRGCLSDADEEDFSVGCCASSGDSPSSKVETNPLLLL